MPFSLLFSVDSRLHTHFARCSTISARIVRGHYADYPRPLHGFSAVNTRIIGVDPRGYPRLSARNNHGILRKKLSFPCHVPYIALAVETKKSTSNYLFCCHGYWPLTWLLSLFLEWPVQSPCPAPSHADLPPHGTSCGQGGGGENNNKFNLTSRQSMQEY